MRSLIYCLILIVVVASCQQPQASQEEQSFSHDIQTEQKPWTHSEFESPKEQLRFAIIGDLSGGERDSIFRVAVAQLNLLKPELIVSVGDLIEGDYKQEEDLHAQWDSFDERAKEASAPLFYVGGNHDLTDQTLWKVWDARYGRRYYHFVYRNVLFLILDTEDHTKERIQEISEARIRAMDSVAQFGWGILDQTVYHRMPEQVAGNIGAQQADYFTEIIKANSGVIHTFILVHKAPWKNKDPEFAQIEQALGNQPYTVFNGHKHAFDHELRNGRDYIRLATTGGVHLPNNGRSADHLTLVSVDSNGASISHLLMAGILDKTGKVPLNGDTLCFEEELCEQLNNISNTE